MKLAYIIEDYLNGNRKHAQIEFFTFYKQFTRETYQDAFDIYGKENVNDIVLNLKTIIYK